MQAKEIHDYLILNLDLEKIKTNTFGTNARFDIHIDSEITMGAIGLLEFIKKPEDRYILTHLKKDHILLSAVGSKIVPEFIYMDKNGGLSYYLRGKEYFLENLDPQSVKKFVIQYLRDWKKEVDAEIQNFRYSLRRRLKGLPPNKYLLELFKDALL